MDCLCGWHLIDGICQVPLAICSNCNYRADDVQAAHQMEVMVRKEWTSHASDPEWVCPEMDMSDAWGILPSVGLSEWFKGVANSIEVPVGELLVRGRAGLRVGNIDSMLEDGRAAIHPGVRVHPLTSGDGKSHVSQQCIMDKLQSFESSSVAKQMVDDLFPTARAVQEAAGVSACLRFAIEYTQFRVLQMLDKIRDTSEETATQRAAVELWRLKCEVQVDLMGMCKTHGVYQIRPVVEHVYECPFTITESYSLKLHYVTPGCLVYKFSTDKFYDPCLDPNNCHTETVTSIALALVTTLVPFDPRSTADPGPIGYWPIAFDTANIAADSRLDDLKTSLDAFDSNSAIPRALSDLFVRNLVHGGGTGAQGFGNVPLNHKWGTSEGTGEDSTMFCDGVHDWWPDDWTKPVGYHVTLPCHHSETAYRTFDSVFAVDESNPANIRMVYQHNTLRDRQSAHSEYGASGLCRKGTYGMPRAITNTMRVCTRDSKDAVYDASVPVKPEYGTNRSTVPVYDDDNVRCADSPYETPWFIEDLANTDPNMLSVGGVPMWDANYLDATYPIASVVNKAGAGVTEWGTDCHEGMHLTCDNTHPCVSMDPVNSPLECVRGVCVRNRALTDTCYSHEDCEPHGQLCTGDGYCSDGVYQIDNEFHEEIEFQIHSAHCTGAPSGPADGQVKPDSYSTVGTSPWERVPDILQMHGMCSYRNWFEFQEFTQSTNSGRSAINTKALCTDKQRNDSLCRAIDSDGTVDTWWDTDLPAEVSSFPTLWGTQRFRVQPHACDRDYMHIDGFAACVPFVTEAASARTGFVTMFNHKISPRSNPRGRTMKTFGMNRFVPVMRMPIPAVAAVANEWRSSGFLSMDLKTMTNADQAGHPFVRCSDVKQCHSDVFTVDGLTTVRTVRPNINPTVQPWQQAWATECGMFGHRVNGVNCQLDLAVMPLYWIMCKDTSGRPYYNQDAYNNVKDTCRNAFDTSSQCSTISRTYASPSTRANDIASSTAALNSLINMISKNVQTGDAYINAMGCTVSIYNAMQLDPFGFKTLYSVGNTKGLYYFLKHTTVEIPFAMWVKCMVLEGITTTTSYGTDASDITCDGWRDPVPANQSRSIDFSMSPMATLKKINGVITSAEVFAARQIMGTHMQQLFSMYTDLLNIPTKAPFFHSGTKLDMQLTCEKMPLLNPAMRLESKVRLLKWGARGLRLPQNYQPGNNNGLSDDGVPDEDCFKRAEPYVINTNNIPTREIDTFTSGTKKKNTLLGQLSPEPWNGLKLSIMKSEYTANNAFRAVDFISNPAVNGKGYIVLAEFNPVDLPPLIIDSRNSDVTVDGSTSTRNKEVRMRMAKHIPCVTPTDVENNFKCPDSLFDELLKKDSCAADRAGITAQINNLKDIILAKQRLVNGELRTGTIDVKNDLRKLNTRQAITLALIPPLPVAYAIFFGVESMKTHKERVAENDNLALWPNNLRDLVNKRLADREKDCISVQSSVPKIKKYCTNPFLNRKRLNLFSDAGAAFMTFQAKVVAEDYGIILTSTGSTLNTTLGPDAASAQAEGSDFTNSLPVYQLFKFSATEQAPTPQRNKEEMDSLIEAIGKEAAADIIARRNTAMDEAFVTMQNILALVDEPSYYDCTEKYSHKVCIRENSVVESIDLNENLDTVNDPVIRKLDGEKGCLELSIPTGERNCLWYMHDGVQQEIDQLNLLTASGSRQWSREEISQAVAKGVKQTCDDGFRFPHPISGTPLDLKVNCDRLPKVTSKTYTLGGPVHRFTDDTDGVVYAVYMRMLAEFMLLNDIPQDNDQWPQAIKSAMSARGLPVSHPLFEIGSGFDRDTVIDLSVARADDDHIDSFQVFSFRYRSGIENLRLTHSFFVRIVSMVSSLPTTKGVHPIIWTPLNKQRQTLRSSCGLMVPY